MRPGAEFIRLGHIVDVRASGEPLYRWAYLHVCDPETGRCAGVAGERWAA